MRRMRWWGWGEDSGARPLPETAMSLITEELGEVEAGERVTLDDVRLPDPVLADGARRRIAGVVGEEAVRDDRESRIVHAAGKGYPDLVRMRAGDASGAPDAVVEPGSAEEVAAVLRACSEERVAVVPFGGGSSVVGGVEPLRGDMAACVSLDLGRLDAVVDVDTRALTATLGPGLFGPDLEAALVGHGVTLGHFPQSFEYSTVGGWVATRSAGQASTGYGRIDELVEGVTLASPAGGLRTRAVPASAAGPSLRELVVGSEGVLGVITEATLRVRPWPAQRRYEAWSFASFEEGCEALRVLAQGGAAPDVARLSDEEETRLTLALSGTGSRVERAGKAYLRLRGHDGGCLAIVGFEGDLDGVARRRQRTAGLLRAAGGLALGTAPGRLWQRGRFAGPYLRDALMDRGVMVETLETAASWSALPGVYEAVRRALGDALSARGTPPSVMCHVSHLYRSGASLYFSFLARQQHGAELEQWRAAKTAAGDAIMAAGATISHHHAVGRDHAPWMAAEVGELGLDLIRAAKERLDPVGIMNPGKLI